MKMYEMNSVLANIGFDFVNILSLNNGIWSCVRDSMSVETSASVSHL